MNLSRIVRWIKKKVIENTIAYDVAVVDALKNLMLFSLVGILLNIFYVLSCN